MEARVDDGSVLYPLGKDAIGYLVYSADGYMSGLIMRADRARFSSENPTTVSVEEKAAAADSCVGYCGRYDVSEGSVVHHTEVSTVPNWVGVDQKRSLHLEGDTLTLSEPWPFTQGGKRVISHVTWVRAQG